MCKVSHELYLDLVSGFYSENRLASPLLAEYNASKDWGSLFRLAHNLKSSASYIGAYTLVAAAQALEAAIEQGQDISLHVNKTVSILVGLIAQLDDVYSQEQQTTPINTLLKPFDSMKAQEYMNQLRTSLKNAEASAEKVV